MKEVSCVTFSMEGPLPEVGMAVFICFQVSVVQLSPGEVLVECHETKLRLTIKTDMHISGVYATKVHTPLLFSPLLSVPYQVPSSSLVTAPTQSFHLSSHTPALFSLLSSFPIGPCDLVERKEA